MLEHWASGVAAVERAMANEGAMIRPGPGVAAQTFDEAAHMTSQVLTPK